MLLAQVSCHMSAGKGYPSFFCNPGVNIPFYNHNSHSFAAQNPFSKE